MTQETQTPETKTDHPEIDGAITKEQVQKAALNNADALANNAQEAQEQIAVGGKRSKLAAQRIQLYGETLISLVGQSFIEAFDIKEEDKEKVAKFDKAMAGLESLVNHWVRHNTVVATSALDFIDMYQHHVIENKHLPHGARLMMEGMNFNVSNFAMMTSRRDMALHPLHGDDDPRWITDPLPLVDLYTGDLTDSIPIKADNGMAIVFGYLELYKEEVTAPDGHKYLQQTEVPIIRHPGGAVIPASIYRWMRIEKDVVEKAFTRGRYYIPHPKPTAEAMREAVGNDK